MKYTFPLKDEEVSVSLGGVNTIQGISCKLLIFEGSYPI